MRDVIFARHFERRIKARHKASKLSVVVRQHGLLNRLRRSYLVRCIDFNRYGMAVTSSQHFRVGEQLSCKLSGPYISSTEIIGVVTSVHEVDSMQRYGLAFAYATDPRCYCREVDNALSRMETIFSQMDNTYTPEAT